MSNSEESTESPAVTATTQQQSTRQETPPPTATGGHPPADRAAPQPPSAAEQSEPTAAETDQPAERTEANAADETPPAALDPAPEENATPAAGSTTTPLAGEDKTPPADDTPALSAEQIAAISERTRERIEKLTLAIENGQLSEAQSLCDRSQNALNKLAKANIQSELEQQLAPLKAELTELLDWKRFADTEKKKALVEQMTALIDNDQAPPARAKKVKALQEEWRGLGHAEDNDRLWAEFSDAARKAFEPCKQYFRERKQLMRENLTQRTRICESLEAYAASIENTDINLAEVNQQESEARKQWKQYAPVAQNKIKQLQARFNEVLSGLRRQRRQALQENARRKLLLIEEAKQLVSDENLKQAISRAKTMQTEWKAIGPAPFRDEREYWQQFRAACDALFARLEKEAPKAEAGRDNRNAGRKPAERSNKTGASASPPAQRTSRRQQALITEVSARASYCQELESALLEGKPLPGENEELTAQWEALPAVSDSVLASQLQQRFDRVCALRADSSALLSAAEDNAEPARKLCVDLEIQAGLPSPDEDRALRMQQQLAQLKQDFGQASLSASQRSEALHRLKLEFFCLGPLTPTLRGRLQPRVEKIR